MESEAKQESEESPEEDTELDLSDLDTLVLEKDDKHTTSEIVDTGNIELEFQVEEDKAEPEAEAEESEAKPAELSDIDIEETLAVTTPDEVPPSREKPFKPKKKTNNALLIIFILVLLGGIAYGIYYAVTVLGVQIPYISDYLNPKPKDPAGIINLSTLEINSKFIENELDGRLFVITGKIHNGYQEPRGQIRLQGKLFTKGKKLAKSEFIYAGQFLDDKALTTMPRDDIVKQLAAVPPLQSTMTRVLPNQNLKFMVVFSDLPAADELDEFAVELVSSVQVQ